MTVHLREKIFLFHCFVEAEQSVGGITDNGLTKTGACIIFLLHYHSWHRKMWLLKRHHSFEGFFEISCRLHASSAESL